MPLTCMFFNTPLNNNLIDKSTRYLEQFQKKKKKRYLELIWISRRSCWCEQLLWGIYIVSTFGISIYLISCVRYKLYSLTILLDTLWSINLNVISLTSVKKKCHFIDVSTNINLDHLVWNFFLMKIENMNIYIW